MIRMLVAGDGGHFFRAVILHRGLAWQVRNPDHPAEPGFGAILPGRDQAVRPVEGAGHDLDLGAADAAKAERRAAGGAEIPFGDRRRTERRRLSARPGKMFVRYVGE